MNVYDLPKSKIGLLIMGEDDEKVYKARKSNVSEIIRKEYEIKNNIDFLINTGGKFDSNVIKKF